MGRADTHAERENNEGEVTHDSHGDFLHMGAVAKCGSVTAFIAKPTTMNKHSYCGHPEAMSAFERTLATRRAGGQVDQR